MVPLTNGAAWFLPVPLLTSVTFTAMTSGAVESGPVAILVALRAEVGGER